MLAHRRDTLESFKLRPEFYRRLYRAVLKIVQINSLVLAALCALTVYLGFYGFKPEHYFTTTPSGKLMEIKYHPAPPPVPKIIPAPVTTSVVDSTTPTPLAQEKPAPLAPGAESPQSNTTPINAPANAKPNP